MFKRVLQTDFDRRCAERAVFAAQAADVTGAGASFPYPIYAKWA